MEKETVILDTFEGSIAYGHTIIVSEILKI